MSGRLDLSDLNAEEAAKELHKYLIDTFDADAMLLSPSEAEEMHGLDPDWTVIWEGGPLEWAVHLTGGESMFTAELGRSSEPEVVGFYDNTDWVAEPYHSFDLQFSER